MKDLVIAGAVVVDVHVALGAAPRATWLGPGSPCIGGGPGITPVMERPAAAA